MTFARSLVLTVVGILLIVGVQMVTPLKGENIQTLVLAVLLIAASIALYFLPTIVGRKKQQALGIFVLNLLLGWTLLGWVGALVWACLREDAPIQS